MPKELDELRGNGQENPCLTEEARRVLDFLGSDRARAYTFREISEGVHPPRRSDVFLPFAPAWAVLREFALGSALETLLRAGQVRQVREASATWYHLSS